MPPASAASQAGARHRGVQEVLAADPGAVEVAPVAAVAVADAEVAEADADDDL